MTFEPVRIYYGVQRSSLEIFTCTQRREPGDKAKNITAFAIAGSQFPKDTCSVVPLYLSPFYLL
jgi:hypothetical protein